MSATVSRLDSVRLGKMARAVLVLAPVLFFAGCAWARRWMDDDGFINLRIVRNILAGHGPVFNVGDRVEAATSPLWIAALTLLGALHIPLESLAVHGGIALSLAGLVLAIRGSERLDAGSVPSRGEIVWPIGAAIYAAIPAAWDYASSGLDTGIGLFWFGASYASVADLVTRAERLGAGPGIQGASPRMRIGAGDYAVAALFGLGPLIRPEFALYSAVWLVVFAACAARRSPMAVGGTRDRASLVRSLLGAGASAAALPLSYEFFRLGYYGAIAPNTATAKEAFRTSWEQGACYFHNFFWVYAMGFPASAAAVFFGVIAWRLRKTDRLRLLALSLPAVAGAIHILYIVAIGGDYMHGRMFLAPVLAMALPVFAVRVREKSGKALYVQLAAGGILSCWAVMCSSRMRCPRDNECYIGDERFWYADQASVSAPIALKTYRGHPFYEDGDKAKAAIEKSCPAIASPETPHEGACRLLYFDDKDFEPLAPTHKTFPLATDVDPRIGAAVGYGAIGIFGYMMPEAVHVIDRHGLADAVGSHLELSLRGRPGHEKTLLSPWLVGRYAARVDPEDATVTAARSALQCGELKELVRAGRAPLTAAQFMWNMTHAFRLASLRIPVDPFDAETLFCKKTDLPRKTTATASSGGLPYRWQCPAGQWVVSLRLAYSDKDGAVERLAASCERDANDAPRAETLRGPPFGGNTDQPMPLESRCPRNTTSIGVYGTRGDLVTAVGLLCSSLGNEAGTPPLHSPTRGRATGAAFELRCPDDTRLIGIEGRAGDLVDHAGIVCAPVAPGP
jgi:arabinofuranosyltransferase